MCDSAQLEQKMRHTRAAGNPFSEQRRSLCGRRGGDRELNRRICQLRLPPTNHPDFPLPIHTTSPWTSPPWASPPASVPHRAPQIPNPRPNPLSLLDSRQTARLPIRSSRGHKEVGEEDVDEGVEIMGGEGGVEGEMDEEGGEGSYSAEDGAGEVL